MALHPHPSVEHHLLKDDGTFPNNERLPLVIYRHAFTEEGKNMASEMEQVIHRQGWGNSWRNGIYTYHHYHSIAHELLGVYQGDAEVQLGGPHGISTKISRGDILIIPAGVAHKKINSTSDFACIGAYPSGQNFDMNYGKAGERPQADARIKKVPLPDKDPLYGINGELLNLWYI